MVHGYFDLNKTNVNDINFYGFIHINSHNYCQKETPIFKAINIFLNFEKLFI